jgi:predicted GNAT family acetyltransferase
MPIALVPKEPVTEKINEMGMFASYMNERENVELVETDKGFATYVVTGTECYIRDIYVKPEFRKSGVAASIADLIAIRAKTVGCKMLTGSVCPTTRGADASLKVLIGYGMRLHSCSNNLIVFIKDLV